MNSYIVLTSANERASQGASRGGTGFSLRGIAGEVSANPAD
jgi:hypothetical protein